MKRTYGNRKALAAVSMALMMMVLSPLPALAESSETYYLNNMYNGTTVYAGRNTGYSEQNPIDKDNYHYGWQLGQFILDGYTAVVKEDGVPVFLVNPGDGIILSYKLLQNIDALNGDTDLKINDDNGGSDLAFQIPKTDLGRGVLFVKHTNHNNRERVTEYHDYLTAVQNRTANAKISNLEEGDYEVALDYEILSDGFWFFNNYEDYRTTFRFKIRNGNCMIYLRDIETKNEFANYSVAPNGFFLDCTSYYQNIVVKRSILTDNGKGYSLTARQCKAASDGARYTDPGIYTVVVKNIYTNESSETVIAVGTDEITNAYVLANCVYNPDRISQMIASGAVRITDDWRIEMIEKPTVAKEYEAEFPSTFAGIASSDTIEIDCNTVYKILAAALFVILVLVFMIFRNRHR